MDLKSNRSDLWRHIIGTCRRLRWFCRKNSNNVARHDKTPVKSTLLSRDMSFMSRRSDIVETFIHLEVATRALSVWLLLQCCDIRHNVFAVVRYIIKHSMKQPDFETIEMTWQAQSKVTGNTRLLLVFSIQNLTRLVTSFLWFQNSIDEAVS